MSRVIKSLKALTEAGLALRDARDKKKAVEEAAKLAKEPLEKEIDELEKMLLDGFKALGMNSFKLDTGHTITRSVKPGVLVSNEYLALEWAVTAKAVKIDMKLTSMKIKQDFIEKNKPVPAGFEVSEREEVRVTVPKPKSEKDEAEAD